jgi:hypothetical protein
MFNGEPGAVPKVIGHWMLRAGLMMPGLALAGVRDRRLVTGALLSSSFVSLFLITYTAFERARHKRRQMLAARRRRGHLAGTASRESGGRRARRGVLGTRYRVAVRDKKFPTPTSLCVEAKNRDAAHAMIQANLARGSKIVRIARGC